MDEHIIKGCPKITPEIKRMYKCTFQRCKNSEFAPVICNLCRKNFCVVHRFPQDHDCTRLALEEVKKSRPQNPNSLNSAIQKVQKRIIDLVTEKKSEKPTAKKVALTKMMAQAKVTNLSNHWEM